MTKVERTSIGQGGTRCASYAKQKVQRFATIADLKKHMGTSDFTKDWVEVRRKIVGAGNRSSKLKSLKV